MATVYLCIHNINNSTYVLLATTRIKITVTGKHLRQKKTRKKTEEKTERETMGQIDTTFTIIDMVLVSMTKSDAVSKSWPCN